MFHTLSSLANCDTISMGVCSGAHEGMKELKGVHTGACRGHTEGHIGAHRKPLGVHKKRGTKGYVGDI